jgi:hypothetical protein
MGIGNESGEWLAGEWDFAAKGRPSSVSELRRVEKEHKAGGIHVYWFHSACCLSPGNLSVHACGANEIKDLMRC